MHQLHGMTFTNGGTDKELEDVPQVFVAESVECVPIKLGDKYFWVVVDFLDNHYANIENPEGEDLDPIEVCLKTDVDNVEDLLKINPGVTYNA